MNRHEIGTIVAWANDGYKFHFDNILTAALNFRTHPDQLKHIFNTDITLGGFTFFRYGIDKEATQAYDKAWDEVEAYEE